MDPVSYIILIGFGLLWMFLLTDNTNFRLNAQLQHFGVVGMLFYFIYALFVRFRP